MNRKVIQWWLTILPISTKPTINHLSSKMTEHKKWLWNMTWEIQVLAWNRHTNVAGLIRLNRSQHLLYKSGHECPFVVTFMDSRIPIWCHYVFVNSVTGILWTIASFESKLCRNILWMTLDNSLFYDNLMTYRKQQERHLWRFRHVQKCISTSITTFTIGLVAILVIMSVSSVITVVILYFSLSGLVSFVKSYSLFLL